MAPLASRPVTDLDPVDDAVLADPYPWYRRLRDAALAVRLRRHGVSVLARYDEVVRHEPPVHALSRVATRDLDVAGTPVPAGAWVLAPVGSANRDERRYPDPDRFDVGRRPADHLGFGHGIHRCLGAALARTEAHAVLGALAARVAQWTVVDQRFQLNNLGRRLGLLRVAAEPAAPAAGR